VLDSLVGPAGQQLLSQGLLGVIVVFLLWYGWQQQQRHDREVAKLEGRIEARDKRINELQDSRLSDARAVHELVSTNRGAIEGLRDAIRGKA
jgi:hypothetical protein